MKSGTKTVIAILLLGSILGLFAVGYHLNQSKQSELLAPAQSL